MTKTYVITLVVNAPEGFEDDFDPYPFDGLLEDQGAEIEDIAIRAWSRTVRSRKEK